MCEHRTRIFPWQGDVLPLNYARYAIYFIAYIRLIDRLCLGRPFHFIFNYIIVFLFYGGCCSQSANAFCFPQDIE
jgi:hypothetical protein